MSEEHPPEKPSKTRRKKDMIALQKMGETLVGLADAQLAKIPLPPEVLEAIQFARTLKAHEAKRRQLQYIGKIMRHVDTEVLELALKKIQFIHEKNTTAFHQIETWRDQLIDQGDEALQLFLQHYPHADRQSLRQLIRKAQNDRSQQKNTGGETELFRYLRDLLEH